MEKLFIAIQYLVPQHLLSRLVGHIASCRWKPVRRLFIGQFARIFRVNMSEAANPDLDSYEHFNAFFTRALREDARPLQTGKGQLCCPVDGAVSQIGSIDDDRVFQAKGHSYSLGTLLGEDQDMVEQFRNGSFATIYLSPRDYHRVHMPIGGTLQRMIYVPGRLFSVNDATTRNVPELFARNERMVALFDTDAGPMAMILVGAMIVAGIETVWSGQVAPPAKGLQRVAYDGQSVRIEKGEEMGRFLLGSTVVLLFGPDRVKWNETLAAGSTSVLGRLLGEHIG